MTPLDTPQVPFAPGDDIASAVARFARQDPGRIALVEGDRQQTWGELDARMNGVAGALLAASIGKGARVAVLAKSSLEYVEVFFGALRAGACVVPLPTMASGEALAAMLVDSEARALFVSAEYRPAVASFLRELPRLGLRAGLDFEDTNFASYTEWRDRAIHSAPDILIAPGDEFDIMYSSGTTGAPKGILHSHAVRKASYAGSRARYFSRDTVNVVATPFYSNTTCVTWFLTTHAGGTNVLLPKFNAEHFLALVEAHKGTHAMLVPVQYDRIFRSERFSDFDVSSLRYLFSTSAPLRPEIKRAILDRTPAELVEIYGLTEGGVVTVLEGRRHPDKLASVGVPSPGCQVRIIDEAGAELPPGQVGEIVGRSPSMMCGYVNRPEETSALFWRDDSGLLYFKTGDIGRFDEEGFLYLLDRKKDLIISGGFNIYASDLEAVLSTHDAVAEAAVVGVPSEQWGETPLALVVLEPGTRAKPEEIREYVNARVGKLQRLHAVELRDELPKNAIGKVLKRELREPYWRASRQGLG